MNQTIKLDTRKREGKYGEARIAPLRRGERNNALLTVKVCANGQPYDLSGKTASLVATTAAGKLVGPCPMEVAEAGIARIMLPAALYSAVGAFTGYVEIREGDTLVDTTDSFGGKVIECADLDSEQAEEFTPLLGELQNAVTEEAKRAEAEKVRVQAETERETGFAEAKQASQAATEAANDAAAGARSAAGSASDAAESANTAAGKAKDAAAKAESDVRAFVNAAGTAVGDAIAGAKADVDVAVKRSDAATAKAEAAVKTADAANTAATKAVGDARDAIAEVKATEAKLYPAAENILVGSDSGTVAHVEDAFAGASLREITIEGACKQDGIPSPDAPKPIAVIENPVLWVTGRNVFRLKPNLAPYSSNGISFTPLKDGGIRVVGTATDTTYYQLDFGPGYYFSIKPFIGQRLFRENISGFSIGYAWIDGSNETLKTDESVPPDAVWWRSFLVERPSGQAVDKLVYPNACIDKLHPYAPNTSQQLAFTLPAEHPYLAKLPDGTADEIVVDQEGNVELVARVLRIKVPESGITWNIQEQSGGFSLGYSGAVPGIKDIRKNLSAKALINDRFESRENWENNPCFGVSGTLWVVPKTNQGAITSEDVAAVANGMVFYAPLATSVTYPLGKIEMPKAQDSIVNVWTDAEVTPSTGIEYVRDVNIVIGNIESAIASITEG